jgi:hypothetical protein
MSIINTLYTICGAEGKRPLLFSEVKQKFNRKTAIVLDDPVREPQMC